MSHHVSNGWPHEATWTHDAQRALEEEQKRLDEERGPWIDKCIITKRMDSCNQSQEYHEFLLLVHFEIYGFTVRLSVEVSYLFAERIFYQVLDST